MPFILQKKTLKHRKKKPSYAAQYVDKYCSLRCYVDTIQAQNQQKMYDVKIKYNMLRLFWWRHNFVTLLQTKSFLLLSTLCHNYVKC